MILYKGVLFETDKQDELILKLEDDIDKTLAKGIALQTDDVIKACDAVAKKVMGGEFDDIVKPFMKMFDVDEAYFEKLCGLFMKEGLERKVSIELSDDEMTIEGFRRRRYPLGVLLHIAAGNFDVLPAYSVVEGLLAGNINILKLPAGDSGLSVRLLSELISVSSALKDFIYVFDVPSTETASIKKLSDLSDAIAVWGGDAAVSAVRRMAQVNTKIISWGHKLSFAYCEEDACDEDLEKLCKAICITNQTLCSSCQGLFLDTDSDEELESFGRRFFDIFLKVNSGMRPVDYGMRAKNAINIYNERLEKTSTGTTVLEGDGISVLIKRDSELELSYMFRSVWIKKLPLEKITGLHKHRDHLQTASILTTDPEKKKKAAKALALAGVVRITSPDTMSRTVPGEAHDGKYALREYSRIVETDLDML